MTAPALTPARRIAPRFTPQPVRPGMIVQNTGKTRLEHGDWSIVQADGSRKPWRNA